MVWLPTTNRVGAIELLIDNHPRQLVRQRQWTEAPDPLGAAENLLGQSVGVPDDECDIARIALPLSCELGELLRRPCFAVAGQCNEARILRGWDSRLFHFPLLDFRVVAATAPRVGAGPPEPPGFHAGSAGGHPRLTAQAYIPPRRCS